MTRTYKLDTDRAALAERYSWVVGGVLAAREAQDGSGVAILKQSQHAFAVVRGTEYLACCQALTYARRLADAS